MWDPSGLDAECVDTPQRAQCLKGSTVVGVRSKSEPAVQYSSPQSLYGSVAGVARVVGAQGARCLASLGVMTGGTAHTMTAETSIRGQGDAMEWLGKEGRWFRVKSQPNGTTGAGRNAIVASGKAARVAARRFGFAGVALSGTQAFSSAADGDWSEAGWHAADAFMAGVGMAGLPGLALSGAWFVGRFVAEC